MYGMTAFYQPTLCYEAAKPRTASPQRMGHPRHRVGQKRKAEGRGTRPDIAPGGTSPTIMGSLQLLTFTLPPYMATPPLGHLCSKLTASPIRQYRDSTVSD